MLCTLCKVEQPDEEFAAYWHSSQQKMRTRKQCKTCCYARSREYKRNMRLKLKEEKQETYQNKFSRLLNSFDSLDYRQFPNQYINETQKELVHTMMSNMFGWTWNEDTGIWSKEGVKDKNNQWSILTKKFVKREKSKKWFTKEYKKQLKEEILKYKSIGKTYVQIANMYGISDTSIYRILKDE
jgi:predicted house-cleaning noncanonical NTP pyrophosphatase (MazG superfamily)